MKEVWIVWGASGEYDDYTDWVVAVYTTRTEAEKHRIAATLWVHDHTQGFSGSDLTECKNPYDPNGDLLRADTHYIIGTPHEVLKKFAPVA